MNNRQRVLRFLVVLVLSGVFPVTNQASEPVAESLTIELPAVVSRGVPVRQIRILALDRDGHHDRSASGVVVVTGVRLEPESDEAWLMRAGELTLRSDIASGTKVFVDSLQVRAELKEDDSAADGQSVRAGVCTVQLVNRWLSLIPPVVAIVLAVLLRNVYVALFVAVWGGVSVLFGGDVFTAFLRTLDTYLPQELTEPGGDGAHMQIIFFTLFLGAMIGVMSRSGGTHALVGRLTRFTSKREHGQVLTWLLGLVVFFDDYANTMLVGSTMRSVSDRLRISRQKLAFLVDATAAPVAGIAIISTWVGFEVSQIESSFQSLGVETDRVFQVFLATIPYRTYPILLLVFTGYLAYSGRDFGPMLRVESAALRGPANGQNDFPMAQSDEYASETDRPLVRNALVPLAVLLVCIAIGMVLHPEDSVPVLLVSSFLGSVCGVGQALLSRSLNLDRAVNAWLEGARSMFIGVFILVLSWAIGTLCDESHLNTAGFIVEIVGDALPVSGLPAISFLLSAVVSFATGSSFATMGLLIPLFVSIAFFLIGGDPAAFGTDAVALATIGGVLAGAIFGDHCSPISDTTVLSSLSAGCEHLDHVSTQIPYAMVVAAISLLLGYLPAGWGVSPWITLPLSLTVTVLVIRVFGRRPTQAADGES